MKTFDLHPKASTAARKKSAAGGLLTLSSIIVAVVLLVQLARVDIGERNEDVRIDSIGHGETLPVELDIEFLQVASCKGTYQVEVIDALGRPIPDPQESLSFSHWFMNCRIQGTIHIPAGKGSFRIYPAMAGMDNMFANHRIISVSVGNRLSGVASEARSLSTESVSKEKSGAWSYYLSLVPTTSNGVRGYQIAATRTFVELQDPRTARGCLFFIYEASPVRMHLDSAFSLSKFFHFLARAFGIVSGLFAFVGLAREVLFTAVVTPSRNKKRKSELVM